jgi:hypothetical protein
MTASEQEEQLTLQRREDFEVFSESQGVSLGGVGVPLGTGVLLLAQTTQREAADLEASNPGLERDTHSSLQARFGHR